MESNSLQPIVLSNFDNDIHCTFYKLVFWSKTFQYTWKHSQFQVERLCLGARLKLRCLLVATFHEKNALSKYLYWKTSMSKLKNSTNHSQWKMVSVCHCQSESCCSGSSATLTIRPCICLNKSGIGCVGIHTLDWRNFEIRWFNGNNLIRIRRTKLNLQSDLSMGKLHVFESESIGKTFDSYLMHPII